MKRFMCGVVVLVSVVAVTPAEAQVRTPGAVWASVGTVSPFERDNVIATVHAEQEVQPVNGLGVFVAADGQRDQRGHAWNNRLIGRAGVRVTQEFWGGMVRGSVSWAREERKGGQSASGWSWAVESWHGWGRR